MTNCTECGGIGYIILEVENTTAAKECTCRRTRPAHTHATPLTEEAASTAVKMLCETLAWAPSTELGQVVITTEIVRMCHSQEEALWLVQRACSLYRDWRKCGLPGLRQILSSRCTPKDRVVISCTDAYLEGVPLEGREPEHVLPVCMKPGALKK